MGSRSEWKKGNRIHWGIHWVMRSGLRLVQRLWLSRSWCCCLHRGQKFWVLPNWGRCRCSYLLVVVGRTLLVLSVLALVLSSSWVSVLPIDPVSALSSSGISVLPIDPVRACWLLMEVRYAVASGIKLGRCWLLMEVRYAVASGIKLGRCCWKCYVLWLRASSSGVADVAVVVF